MVSTVYLILVKVRKKKVGDTLGNSLNFPHYI